MPYATSDEHICATEVRLPARCGISAMAQLQMAAYLEDVLEPDDELVPVELLQEDYLT